MKKILALMLAVFMIWSLAACNSSNNANQDKSSQDNTESSSSLKDSSDASSSKSENSEELDTSAANEGKIENFNKAVDLIESVFGSENISKYKKNENKDVSVDFSWDILKDNNKRPEQEMELDISFDGYHLTKGTMFTELSSNGFELEYPDRIVQAGHSIKPEKCKNKSSGREIELRLTNSSNKDKKYKDCEITGITFLGNCQGVNYKGLTKDSSLEDVINKLGIPVNDSGPSITVNGKINSDAVFIILSYGKQGKSQMQIKLAYDPVQNTAKLIEMDYNHTGSIENNTNY